MDRRAGILVAIVTLCALAAAPAQAAFPGGNGRIVFTTSQYEGNENIYSIQPDGTGLTRLTADPGFDDDAAWSPNGRKIAFASNRAHPAQACEGLNPRCDYDVYVMNADGSGVVRLTDSPGSDRYPEWSPDGRRIVFSSTRDSAPPAGEFFNADLYAMDADGSGEVRITTDPGVDSFPAWSPLGGSIVFRRAECEFNCTSRLFKIAPDGSGLQQLTFDTEFGGPGNERDSDWSPDGLKIVFERLEGHLWTMNPDGSDVRIIFGSHRDPAWSPDGTKIAFMFPGIGHMNADGSSPIAIHPGGEKPDWQPLVVPRREDFANGPAFCRAEREFLGETAFRAKYGGGSNAFGKCVGANG